jgi:hypothetical protein
MVELNRGMIDNVIAVFVYYIITEDGGHRTESCLALSYLPTPTLTPHFVGPKHGQAIRTPKLYILLAPS